MDFRKKVTRGGIGLEPGEQVLATVPANPLGTTAQMMGSGVGGLAGAVVGARSARRAQDRDARRRADEGAVEGGLAATYPDIGQHLLSVTDRRWLVHATSAMTGKAKALVHDVDGGDVVGHSVTRAKLTSTLVLRFRDGSQLALELPRLAKVDDLVAAATQVGAPAC